MLVSSVLEKGTFEIWEDNKLGKLDRTNNVLLLLEWQARGQCRLPAAHHFEAC